MLLGQELKFKNKLCNLKLGTFFSALPGLGASALSGRVGQNLRKFNTLKSSLRTPVPFLQLFQTFYEHIEVLFSKIILR